MPSKKPSWIDADDDIIEKFMPLLTILEMARYAAQSGRTETSDSWIARIELMETILGDCMIAVSEEVEA